jgi:hypothetical protein
MHGLFSQSKDGGHEKLKYKLGAGVQDESCPALLFIRNGKVLDVTSFLKELKLVLRIEI